MRPNTRLYPHRDRRAARSAKKGTGCFFYLFLGLPSGRNVDSNPNFSLTASCHSFSPNGDWRFTLFRCLSNSSSVSGLSTYDDQSSGNATGNSSVHFRILRSAFSRCDDQRQSLALSTNFARTGFASMYRATVNKWSSCWTMKLLNLPCQT